MKNYIVISVLVLVLLYIFKDKINMEYWYKVAGIFGFTIAALTLYFNFLKPADPTISIGRRCIVIWHDTMLQSAPMLDVFCTISNDGAQSLKIDKIEIELIRNKEKAEFSDYLFLKLINGFQFQQDTYSHPLIIDKYSNYSQMIGFRNKDLKYDFTDGVYTLKIKAISNNKSVAQDTVNFTLSKEESDRIKTFKNNSKKEAFEKKLE